MNQFGILTGAFALAFGLCNGAMAHFQEIIPSADYVSLDAPKTIRLDLAFTHPMEGGPAMEMKAPAAFGVTVGGKTHDLSKSLKPTKLQGVQAFQTDYTLTEPADYIFHVSPQPYWEPAEGKSIIHYTKVIVDYGMGEGWDEMVGLPVEIEPLVQPYSLFVGNQFRGIVTHNGKPVPFAEIEVEWKNDGSLAPSDPFITQVIKADASGQFSYSLPRAGWWGFAALVEADYQINDPDGKPQPVELGGLIWVKAHDMNQMRVKK